MNRKQKERYKAKALLISGKYTSRQIAEMVGVNENTVSRWIRKYGWNGAEKGEFIKITTQAHGVISPAFVSYLQLVNPHIMNQIGAEVLRFLNGNITQDPETLRLWMVEEIKRLMEKNGFSESGYAGADIDQVNTLSDDEAKYMLHSLQEYDRFNYN